MEKDANYIGKSFDLYSYRYTYTYDTNENATFEITRDSIYYVDHNATYKYDLIGDSIKIKFDDFISTGKVNFVGDTLIITYENGESKYWHFKY